MNDKIRPIPTAQRDELLGALEQMRRTLPLLEQMQDLTVAMRRRLYAKYVEAGFTEAQALELAKTHSAINP